MDDYQFAILYFSVINIAGFLLIKIDKMKAIKHSQRIPERNFFIFTFLGAGIGVFISMLLFRHKTKHKIFMIGIPIVTAIFYSVAMYMIFGG
ncbi:MAG: DUF1294 domain-containing protein [Saccharofermentanales bacterium]